MKARDPRAFFYDVIEACDTIASFVRGRSLAEYRQDTLLRSAVERQLTIIGEAMVRGVRAIPSLGEQVPDLDRIVAVRNRLVHGYAHVSDELIWGVVESSVPGLRAEIARLLA